MLQVLSIQDLRHDWLNTIVVFDDSGSSGLFRNPIPVSTTDSDYVEMIMPSIS
jgi:hypothetical protein